MNWIWEYTKYILCHAKVSVFLPYNFSQEGIRGCVPLKAVNKAIRRCGIQETRESSTWEILEGYFLDECKGW